MSKKQSSTVFWLTSILAITFGPTVAWGQLSDTRAWVADIDGQYRIVPNITYLTANNYQAKLDLYTPRNPSQPSPVLVYIHGGGWVGGSKESSTLRLLPYLQMGWSVINVEYRLARNSLAPAAVEDCRCALRWIIRNAEEYNLNPDKIVLTGHSAGGHLSLTTGILPASAGLDRQCPGNEILKVAAIINWYGITDVGDLLEGPNMKTYAVAWMGSMKNRHDIAGRVSPLAYVRPGLPPILTIHGDADPTVPYDQAVKLHDSLTKARVPNQLLTIPGGRHGRFGREQTLRAYTTIKEFLEKHGL